MERHQGQKQAKERVEVCGVAVLDPQNMVEYVGTLGCVRQQDDVENIMYASIDVLESLGTTQQQGKPTGPVYELYRLSGYCVYGYVTSTRKKILVLIRDVAEDVKEEVSVICRNILKEYLDEIANPFHTRRHGRVIINGGRFEKRIQKVI